MTNVIVPNYIQNQLLNNIIALVHKIRVQQQNNLDSYTQQIVMKAKVDIYSETMLNVILKIMGKYKSWKKIDKWRENIWCTYKSSNGKTYVYKNEDKQNYMMQEIYPSIRFSSDVTNATHMTVSAMQYIPQSNLKSDRCVLPSQCTIDYSKTFESDMWRFNVVKSWSNQTLKLALSSMDHAQPNMFIALELIHPNRYFNLHTDTYIAASVLIKLACIFGEKCRLFH